MANSALQAPRGAVHLTAVFVPCPKPEPLDRRIGWNCRYNGSAQRLIVAGGRPSLRRKFREIVLDENGGVAPNVPGDLWHELLLQRVADVHREILELVAIDFRQERVCDGFGPSRYP